MVSEVTSAVIARITTTPKTILGFFLAVMGIDVVGTTGAVSALAYSSEASAVPYVLVAGAVIFVAVLLFILVLTVKSPAKLQLGHVNATEYIAIRKVELGDSDAGSGSEVIVLPEAPAAMTPGPPVERSLKEIEPADDRQEPEEES